MFRVDAPHLQLYQLYSVHTYPGNVNVATSIKWTILESELFYAFIIIPLAAITATCYFIFQVEIRLQFGRFGFVWSPMAGHARTHTHTHLSDVSMCILTD